MPKIIKTFSIYILAFFIFGTFLSLPSNAQDAVTLKNGLELIVREDHRNPIMVFSVFIDVGSASEDEYSGSGASHLVEHMLFKGTKKYPQGTIENILHIYGGKIDGWTSYDYTGFRITILKEHADVAIDILKEMLSSPTFNEKELKKEKEVIEREMDLSKDDPGRKISRLTFSSAYIRHPYRIPIIGYKENFRRLDRKKLLSFFRENYTPERMVITVVGDMDREKTLGAIKDAFGDLPRGKNTFPSIPQEPEQITKREVEEALDIEGSYLNIAFHSTGLLDKDLYAMDILSFILGGGESSILNKRIRLEKELALSVSAYNYTPRYPGLFVISSVLKDEKISEVAGEIMKEIEGIKEKGVESEELEKAKNNFIAGYIYQKETLESQGNDLAIAELLTGNPEFFELYIERIKSVTLADVQRVANRYLNEDNMTVVAITKSGKALSSLKKNPTFKKKERQIKKITLSNNLPVLICEDRSLPILSVSLVLKDGLRLETEKNNGVAKLKSLMLRNGTDSMSREEIALFYESKGMDVSTYSGNNSSGILIDCLKKDTEAALKLASELLLSSTFPEKELARVKRELSSAIEMQDNQIFNHGHRLLKKLLFTSHPYGLQAIGTRESIEGIKREDALEFFKSLLFTGNMVLGISGDCDADEVIALAEKYFGRIASEKKNLSVPEAELPIDKIRASESGTLKEQSLVLIGFRGIDIYSKDRYALEVMTDLIASESGILFKKIREESGLSYATGAFQVLGIDPGYLAIYTLTSKENIKKVTAIILKEMKLFIKNGVPEEDIQKAKNHLKAMRQIELQTNSGFLFMACLDELYGLGYDNYKDYNRNIDSVTKKAIERAANNILTLDKYAIVTLEGK